MTQHLLGPGFIAAKKALTLQYFTSKGLSDVGQVDQIDRSNRLLDQTCWRVFDDERGPANIQLKSKVTFRFRIRPNKLLSAYSHS